MIWTITLLGGRDPLPVLQTWPTRERAEAASEYWRPWGYIVHVHELGAVVCQCGDGSCMLCDDFGMVPA